MGVGKGLVGFQGYKGCIKGYGLFEQNMVIYKFNYSLYNPTQPPDCCCQIHWEDLQWL